MSSDPTPPQIEAQLDTYNFTGGFPISRDFAPSIIFTIIYIAILPLLIYRIVRRPSRTWILVRPAIFLPARIATYILRAVMSKNTYGIGELIGELILVSVGFIFLISPVVDMWKRHVASEVAQDAQPWWLRRLVRITHVVLIAAIATAIVGSSLMSSATSPTADPSTQDTVQALRKASYLLSLAIVVITLLGVAYTHIHFRLRTRSTALLVAISAFCFVTAIYRVIQLFTADPAAGVRSLPAFYILQATMEVFALVLILSVNINDWFPGGDGSDTQQTQAYTYKPEQVA